MQRMQEKCKENVNTCENAKPYAKLINAWKCREKCEYPWKSRFLGKFAFQAFGLGSSHLRLFSLFLHCVFITSCEKIVLIILYYCHIPFALPAAIANVRTEACD